MSKFLRKLWLAVFVMYPGTGVALAEEPPSVTSTHVKGPLYVLQGRGGNVLASVGDDGVLLVDGDYTQYAPAYAAELARLAPDDGQPRFLLNTHWHSDHTGSNGFWAERGSVVMAHDNVRRRMSTRQERDGGRVIEASPAEALPVVTYGDSLALHFNGDDIEVQHYPGGHTDGDSVVYFAAENVVHIGDLLFNDLFPFVDVASGGNVFRAIEQMEKVLERIDEDTIVIAGHGEPLANRVDLERSLEMMKTTSKLVTDKLAQGQTLESVTAEGLGEQWASWNWSFVKEAGWISFIAASL